MSNHDPLPAPTHSPNTLTCQLSMSISSQYEFLTTHITPGPKSISYFISPILLLTSLLIPPRILTHHQLALVFLPPIYLSLVHAWFQLGGVDTISVDVALWSFALLGYRDPRRMFRRICPVGVEAQGEQGGNGKAEEREKAEERWCEQAYPDDLASRVSWAWSLFFSYQFTDWKIGDPSHDSTQPPTRMSRLAFFKHASITLLRSYLILDLSCAYGQTDPYFSHRIPIDTPFPHPPASPAFPLPFLYFPPRLIRSAALAAQTYAGVTLMFYPPALPALLLNTLSLLPTPWTPHSWPPFFGPFSAVTTSGLRGLWGRWWHQMHRQLTSTPGRALNNALGISTSSPLGYASLVSTAFFFSGLVHMGLVPPQPLNASMSATAIRLYFAAFFWVQVPGFALDIAVLHILDQLNLPPLLRKTLVFSWVALWLSVCLPLVGIAFRELGYWKIYPLPISVVQGVLGGRWWMW